MMGLLYDTFHSRRYVLNRASGELAALILRIIDEYGWTHSEEIGVIADTIGNPFRWKFPPEEKTGENDMLRGIKKLVGMYEFNIVEMVYILADNLKSFALSNVLAWKENELNGK